MLKFIYRCFVPRCCHWVLPANQKCNFYFTLSALHCHLSIAILNNSFAIVFLSWGVHVASLVSSVIARLAIDLEYPQRPLQMDQWLCCYHEVLVWFGTRNKTF